MLTSFRLAKPATGSISGFWEQWNEGSGEAFVMTQHITLWQPPEFDTRWLHRFTNAELTGNTYLSGTLGRKPQNMLASLWSDWFSTSTRRTSKIMNVIHIQAKERVGRRLDGRIRYSKVPGFRLVDIPGRGSLGQVRPLQNLNHGKSSGTLISAAPIL